MSEQQVDNNLEDDKKKEVINFQVQRRRKKGLDKSIKELSNSPFYKDLMQKCEASSSRSIDFLIETNPNSTMNDDSSIYVEAEIIMEMIVSGEISLGNLDLRQKAHLLYYLERYNKRVGRILDILTRIPMTSVRLQKPLTRYQIINDYVLRVFDRIFNSFSFQEMLDKVVRHYWLFSYSAVLIEDDYSFLTDSILLDDVSVSEPLENFKGIETIDDLNVDDIKKIDDIYGRTPEKVSAKDRRRVIESVLKIHSPKYKGPIKFTVLSALSTLDRNENTDIDFYIYRIPVSENLRDSINRIRESLDQTELNKEDLINEVFATGYSRAMINAFLDYEEEGFISNNQGVNQEQCILVDTDPYSSLGMYIAPFQRTGLARLDNSVFNRVLNDCIDLQLTTLRLREYVNRGYKKDVLVTLGEMEDYDKIAELEDMLTNAANNQEGSITCTNMDANVQEIDLTVNSNLDLSELIDNANQNISEGVGIPESLITDSADSYANSFLKTVLMENEFTEFRNSIKRFIEKKIFEPIALKMGFVMADEWGELKAIYPELKFDKLHLAQGSDALQQSYELSRDGLLPMSYVYEAMGIDPKEAYSKMHEEQFTFSNQSLREAVSERLGEIVGGLVVNTNDMADKIASGLDIKPEAVKQAIEKLTSASDDDESSGGRGGRW